MVAIATIEEREAWVMARLDGGDEAAKGSRSRGRFGFGPQYRAVPRPDATGRRTAGAAQRNIAARASL